MFEASAGKDADTRQLLAPAQASLVAHSASVHLLCLPNFAHQHCRPLAGTREAVTQAADEAGLHPASSRTDSPAGIAPPEQ